MATKDPRLDRLTSQLYHLPAIIGRLGVSIAEAQKELNLDYVTNVGRLMEMMKDTLGKSADPDKQDALRALLEALAPPRFQFTETTIEFSADLSETLRAGAQAGASVGTAALMVNAAFTLGFGYDYRAAARVKSVLHAMPAGGDPGFPKALLDRAKEVDPGKLGLPDRTDLDKELYDRVSKVYDALPKPGGAGG